METLDLQEDAHDLLGLVYLATPYSHPDPEVRLRRFHAVNLLAAKLMAKGLLIFSPISHTHPIAEADGLPLDWEFWSRYDQVMLAACSAMIVYRQAGWEESVGVQAEITLARELGLPIMFCDP
jgi:hypothetical protein